MKLGVEENNIENDAVNRRSAAESADQEKICTKGIESMKFFEIKLSKSKNGSETIIFYIDTDRCTHRRSSNHLFSFLGSVSYTATNVIHRPLDQHIDLIRMFLSRCLRINPNTIFRPRRPHKRS